MFLLNNFSMAEEIITLISKEYATGNFQSKLTEANEGDNIKITGEGDNLKISAEVPAQAKTTITTSDERVAVTETQTGYDLALNGSFVEEGEYRVLESTVGGHTTSITALEQSVAGKQDTLTAGTGINLNNNTISVDTATTVGDSNLPVTASAVNTKLGDYATTTDLNNKQDDVGLFIDSDGRLGFDKGINQGGGAVYENFFDSPTTFGNYVEFQSDAVIQNKKPVLDVTSSDDSVTITRTSNGYGVDLKANGGGSIDENPLFRIITWRTGDDMSPTRYTTARPEDATYGNVTIETFNNECRNYDWCAFAVALNEYTWLVTRGKDCYWNDNDFGLFCWGSLIHLKERL